MFLFILLHAYFYYISFLIKLAYDVSVMNIKFETYSKDLFDIICEHNKQISDLCEHKKQ
jgi:hypothetical protein